MSKHANDKPVKAFWMRTDVGINCQKLSTSSLRLSGSGRLLASEKRIKGIRSTSLMYLFKKMYLLSQKRCAGRGNFIATADMDKRIYPNRVL